MNKLCCFFILSIILSGCATTTPQATQYDSANTNPDVLRFDQAKALSASDIPDINISRLSKGSKVKIKHTQDGSDAIYFTIKTVKDVKAADNSKIYVIDSVTEGRTYTFSENSASLRKVVSPYENTQPLTDFKDLPGSSMSQQILNVIGTGNLAIGIIAAPIEHAQEKERNKEIGDQMRAMRIERKIIDFKYVSDETLKVSNKNILCKVYEVHSLTRQTMPSSKIMPSSSFVMDGSERIWVCDDVPFGIVKMEITQTAHMFVAGDNRSHAAIPSSLQTTHEINEVVEFSY